MHNPPEPRSLDPYIVRRGRPGMPLVVHFEDVEPDHRISDLIDRGAFSLVCLSDREGRWYQQGVPGVAPTLDGVADQLRSLCSELKATDIACIGAGMGGYGAIAVAARLKTRALAFNPDTVIGVPLTASSDLGTEYRDVVGDLKPLLEGAGCSVELICGEFDAGALFGAEHLLSVPGVKVYSLRGADDVVQALNERNLLNLILRRFIVGKPIHKHLAGLEGGLSRAPAAIFWLYEALNAKVANDWVHCRDCALTALRFSPGSALAHFYAGYGLMRRKEGDCGLSDFTLASAYAPRNAKAHLHIALAFRAAGDRLGSLEILDAHLVRWPDDSDAWVYVDEMEKWPGKSPGAAHVLRSVEAIQLRHGRSLAAETSPAGTPGEAEQAKRAGRAGGLIGKLLAKIR